MMRPKMSKTERPESGVFLKDRKLIHPSEAEQTIADRDKDPLITIVPYKRRKLADGLTVPDGCVEEVINGVTLFFKKPYEEPTWQLPLDTTLTHRIKRSSWLKSTFSNAMKLAGVVRDRVLRILNSLRSRVTTSKKPKTK